MAGSHWRARLWGHIPQQAHCSLQPSSTHGASNRSVLLSFAISFVLLIPYRHMLRFYFINCWYALICYASMPDNLYGSLLVNCTYKGVPHLREDETPPQGGTPGWAAIPNPRIGPWLRLMQKIAAEQGLVPEFEVVCSPSVTHIFLWQLILIMTASEDYTWGYSPWTSYQHAHHVCRDRYKLISILTFFFCFLHVIIVHPLESSFYNLQKKP